jgi:hypothetical protein
MPFFIDDLILRAFGISLQPFDMIWIFEQVRDYAYQQMYDPEEVAGQIKENRMLYEAGEVTKEEYERNHSELQDKLKIARRVREMNLNKRLDLFGMQGILEKLDPLGLLGVDTSTERG